MQLHVMAQFTAYMPWPNDKLTEKLVGMATDASRPKGPQARITARSDSFDPVVAGACGSVLRTWRVELGIAQDAFALLAGIDRSYYGKLERGERQPSLSVLLKCAAAFAQPAAKLVEAIEHQLRVARNATLR